MQAETRLGLLLVKSPHAAQLNEVLCTEYTHTLQPTGQRLYFALRSPSGAHIYAV